MRRRRRRRRRRGFEAKLIFARDDLCRV